MNGADLIHRVRNKTGHCCGTIVWESKRTKAWSDGWLQKLKDDLRLVQGGVPGTAWERQTSARMTSPFAAPPKDHSRPGLVLVGVVETAVGGRAK